jgi:NADP-dependent 3-hydroxy acid dehydrogenase YdfG
MPDSAHPLAGRVALITGASRGIGKATALRLAQAGAAIVLAARTVAALDEVADTIRALGREALALPTDVTDNQQLEALVATTHAHFGRIDMLVNNAGGGPPRTSIQKARVADWEWTLRVNLWATMLLTKLVLPFMIERRSGVIVNICSQAGLSGKAGEAAYAAAKFGVRGFTQALFDEVRPYDIKVSAIHPGYVDTTMIPPNRRLERAKMLKAEDVAEAVYQVATSSRWTCPVEIILQPQQDPLKT